MHPSLTAPSTVLASRSRLCSDEYSNAGQARTRFSWMSACVVMSDEKWPLEPGLNGLADNWLELLNERLR